MGNTVKRFCSIFEDEHQSTIPESDITDDEVEGTTQKPKKDYSRKPKDYDKMEAQKKEKKRQKDALKLLKKGGAQAMKGQKELGQLGATGKQFLWMQHLQQVRIEAMEADGEEGAGNTEGMAIKADRQGRTITATMLDSVTSLGDALHTIELTRCNLKKFPPNLEELQGLKVIKMSHNYLDHIPMDVANCNGLEELVLDRNLLGAMEPGVFGVYKFNELKVIDLSFNQIKMLPLDFGLGLVNVKYIDVSNNQMQILPDAILRCKSLEVFIASKNHLHKLPDDLGHLTKLRKLFVSFNDLTTLPDTIGDCRHLEKIRVVENRIRVMPDSVLKLWNFSVPSCRHAGKITKPFPCAAGEEPMMYTPGRLEELLVSRNPLVHPSITAFELGGLNQAFFLFEEWIIKRLTEEEETRKRLEEELARQLQAIKDGSPDDYDVIAPDPVAQQIPETAAPAAGAPGGPQTAAPPAAEDQEAPQQEESSANFFKPGTAVSVDNNYFFAHCCRDGKWNVKKIAEIRASESTLLMMKKNMYVEKQLELAKAKVQELQREKTEGFYVSDIPHQYRVFLEEHEEGKEPTLVKNFDVTKYHDKIRVVDLDLYFNLLVYSTKPMFSTCMNLLDKFAADTIESGENEGDTGVMTQTEWVNFCARVPVKLPPAIVEEMFKLLAWRSIQQREAEQGPASPTAAQAMDQDVIQADDFIAAWHIHDVENDKKDQWIWRVTKVLKLEYFDMDFTEMRLRLLAKGAVDADPTLDFDGDADDESGGGEDDEGDAEEKMELVTVAPTVAPSFLEGERRVATPHGLHAQLPSAGTGGGGKGASAEKPLVSMTEAMYATLQAEKAAEQADSDIDEVESLHSSKLSQDSDESEYEWNAQDELEGWVGEEASELDPDEAGQGGTGPGGNLRTVNLDISSEGCERDDGLRKLMTMHPKDILHSGKGKSSKKSLDKSREQAKEKAKAEAMKKKNKQQPVFTDARFKTNVYSVRQCIRQLYRMFPHDDFVKLINYLLRNMRNIKHVTDGPSYWHVDEPTFKNTMGCHAGDNQYTHRLLLQMGFVLVNDTHWVWPYLHVSGSKEGGGDKKKEITSWGDRLVPAHCPGRHPNRLEDMITLFKLCQKSLNEHNKRLNDVTTRASASYNGHF